MHKTQVWTVSTLLRGEGCPIRTPSTPLALPCPLSWWCRGGSWSAARPGSPRSASGLGTSARLVSSIGTGPTFLTYSHNFTGAPCLLPPFPRLLPPFSPPTSPQGGSQSLPLLISSPKATVVKVGFLQSASIGFVYPYTKILNLQGVPKHWTPLDFSKCLLLDTQWQNYSIKVSGFLLSK